MMKFKKLKSKLFNAPWKKKGKYDVQKAVERIMNEEANETYTQISERQNFNQEYGPELGVVPVGRGDTETLSDLLMNDMFPTQNISVPLYRIRSSLTNESFEYFIPIPREEQNFIDNNGRNPNPVPYNALLRPLDTSQESIDINYERYLQQLRDAKELIPDNEIRRIRTAYNRMARIRSTSTDSLLWSDTSASEKFKKWYNNLMQVYLNNNDKINPHSKWNSLTQHNIDEQSYNEERMLEHPEEKKERDVRLLEMVNEKLDMLNHETKTPSYVRRIFRELEQLISESLSGESRIFNILGIKVWTYYHLMEIL
ncbi:hypothetical protein EVAR_101579_1 [Eumeta japonica]|uniref:Uncharacterized protein n=1 Tax=Eumeta variegata TaxID=151549 RepID=A0A4C1T655_EUMVA|nr:hypothetical protein EVAR_101579_1 [Eumeta japonica]